MELFKKSPQESMVHLSVNFVEPFHEIAFERVIPTRYVFLDLLLLDKRYLDIIVNLAFALEERDGLSSVQDHYRCLLIEDIRNHFLDQRKSHLPFITLRGILIFCYEKFLMRIVKNSHVHPAVNIPEKWLNDDAKYPID